MVSACPPKALLNSIAFCAAFAAFLAFLTSSFLITATTALEPAALGVPVEKWQRLNTGQVLPTSQLILHIIVMLTKALAYRVLHYIDMRSCTMQGSSNTRDVPTERVLSPF